MLSLTKTCKREEGIATLCLTAPQIVLEQPWWRKSLQATVREPGASAFFPSAPSERTRNRASQRKILSTVR